jgi:6-phosphogluconate dehydrogenase
MVHNGIEYGLMEAYGEGLEILEKSKFYDLDLLKITGIWNHGSVIRSWLLELAEDALRKDPDLRACVATSRIRAKDDGRWRRRSMRMSRRPSSRSRSFVALNPDRRNLYC